VVLSGRLKQSRFVNRLRKHGFVLEFSKLSETDTQKELIKAIASHIQQNRSIAIDKPMFELLRKQYRLDDMPGVLAKKGVVMNVLEFMEEQGQQKAEKNTNFTKNIGIELNDLNDHISLTINDNGIGFDRLSNNVKEILNPYFTTKKQGTGLGLSIVNKIINDHNGELNFFSIPNGAKVEINFNLNGN